MAVFAKQRLPADPSEVVLAPGRPGVLIVDDEAANLAVMRTILGPYFNVMQASNGALALAMIDAMPDPSELACIISDQRMPCLTGLELFQRTAARMPATARIIVTGHVDIDTIVDAINVGEIYQFIVKPFDAHDFLLTVRRAVEAFGLRRQLDAYYRDLATQVALRTRELELSRRALIDKNRQLQGEIDERMRIEIELARSSAQILALYNNASCGYFSLDQEGVLQQINDTALAWLGRTRGDVLGKLRLCDIVAPDSWQTLITQHPPQAGHAWCAALDDIELDLTTLAGRTVPVLLSGVSGEEDGRKVLRCTVFNHAKRRAAFQRLHHHASHDGLTGLANRSLLQDRIERDMLHGRRNRLSVALLFIDLDRFKQVNDTFGHQMGDKLLQQVARRMEQCVRTTDSIIRLGGDEFVISLANLGDSADVHAIVEKIIAALARRFDIDNQTLEVSASVGVSIFPQDGEDVATLVERADEAMYRAKRLGRNNYQLYSALRPASTARAC